MLGGLHGLLDALFETVLMVADERSLMEANATFKPDLVVVDLSLPKSGEVNIVRRLMSQNADVSLVVLSVHDDPTVASVVLNEGAAGFVLKRSAATDLTSAVNEVLRGGVFVSPSVQRIRDEIDGTDPAGSSEEK
jgi:DNA-binding NarL/FixJ family response regulator